MATSNLLHHLPTTIELQRSPEGKQRRPLTEQRPYRFPKRTLYHPIAGPGEDRQWRGRTGLFRLDRIATSGV